MGSLDVIRPRPLSERSEVLEDIATGIGGDEALKLVVKSPGSAAQPADRRKHASLRAKWW